MPRGCLTVSSAFSVDDETEELATLALVILLAIWVADETDALVTVTMFANSTAELDAELDAAAIRDTARANTDPLDDSDTSAVIAGVALMVDKDNDAAIAKGLVMFPSVWVTLEEALVTLGRERAANLSPVEAVDNDATDTGDLWIRRLNTDAIDVDPQDGNERNCCLLDVVADEPDVGGIGVFKTNISTADDDDNAVGNGLYAFLDVTLFSELEPIAVNGAK